MEIIKNLSNLQKGLLAGLAIGIVAVYICLCLAAVGIVPLSLPGVRPGRAVADALPSVASSPTPTPMSDLPAVEPTLTAVEVAAVEPTSEPSPTATLEPIEQPTATPTVMSPQLQAVEPSEPLVANPAQQAGPIAAIPEAPSAPSTGEAGARIEVNTVERVLADTISPPPVVALAMPTTFAPTAAPAARSAVEMNGLLRAQPAAPGPTPVWTWQGVEVERRPGQAGSAATVLAVRVLGLPNREVYVREVTSGLSTTLVTGRKPQYGDFSDDITGLPPATYVIEPKDIDAQAQVTLGPGEFVLVEFALRPPPGSEPPDTTAATPVAVTQGTPVIQQRGAMPSPTSPPPRIILTAEVPATRLLAQPAQPTQAAALAAPTPQPEWTWQGIVYEHRKNTGAPVGIIAVRVVEVPDRKVFVKEKSGTWQTTLVTGRKPEHGRFSDDVGGLSPGTYVIKPMDIDSEVEVTLEQGDFVLVEFALRPAPGWTPSPTQAAPPPAVQQAPPIEPAQPTQAAALAAPTPQPEWTWQGIVYEHRKNTGAPVGIIAVRVVEVPDRKVFVKEKSGTWQTTLVTGRKPEHGRFSDDVGGLSPGTYVIKPMDIDSEVEVTLEQGDFVLVEFALRPAPGWTPGPSAAASGQSGLTMGEGLASVAPTPTLVPGWIWEAREIERKPGVQTGNSLARLVIRGIALPNWEVSVRQAIGGATTVLRLERHPEYGNFAGVLEGLTPATYIVGLTGGVGIPAQVTLGQGDFVLLEFFPKPAAAP